MDWKQVDAYYMRSGFGHGNFYIAKAFVAGDAKYSLWSAPRTLHGIFPTAAAAKRAAESLVGVLAAGGDGAGAGCAVGDGVAADASGG
jgi:hypothetical protein